MSYKSDAESALLHLTPHQLLSLWSDLERAYHGKHPFGGYIAEIYAYRCADGSWNLGGTDAMKRKRHTTAARSLVAVCDLFQRERSCKVKIQNMVPSLWFRAHSSEFEHRVRIEVIP